MNADDLRSIEYATELNDIALTLKNMELNDAALTTEKKCLSIRKEVLGESHHYTAYSYSKKVHIEIQEKVLGIFKNA